MGVVRLGTVKTVVESKLEGILGCEKAILSRFDRNSNNVYSLDET